MLKDQGGGVSTTAERVKYSAFGVPYLIPPGDVDYNGELDIFDNMEFGNRFTAEDHRADLNNDGVFDIFDYLDFANALYSGEVVTRGALSRLDIENRIGYAGAVWDSHLNLWVMRHRLYDPTRGRFLQRDPIGYAGGWNLYEYCNSQPMDLVDPWGLDGYWITRGIRGSIVGDYLDDTFDGARELFAPESDLGQQAQTAVIVSAATVAVVATGGSVLITALPAAAANVVVAISAGTAVYVGGEILWEATTGTELWTGRELSEDERALTAARGVGFGLGGLAVARAAGPIGRALAYLRGSGTGVAYHYTTAANVAKIARSNVVFPSRNGVLYATTISPHSMAKYPWLSVLIGRFPWQVTHAVRVSGTESHWVPWFRIIRGPRCLEGP